MRESGFKMLLAVAAGERRPVVGEQGKRLARGPNPLSDSRTSDARIVHARSGLAAAGPG